jgi:polysaccharide pyruvyl transferase CsaB
MRYLLGGYYGMRNVGDDVLLYTTLAETARHDGAASFTVVSELPEVTPPGLRVRITAGGRRFENVRQMLHHDVWLFGGGGLLQDGSPRAADYLERLTQSARVVRLLGRRIALVGIGVGPLGTPRGRAAAAALLRQADLVTVRDAESRALAAELAPDVDVQVTGDLAFLLGRHVATAPVTPDSANVLGVSLLPYGRSLGRSADGDERGAVMLARALRDTLRRNAGWRVTLFEFFANPSYGDAHVLRLVEQELADPGRVSYRPYRGDFLEVFAEMRACQAFVGMRFHSCLLAHLAGVPCLMLAYHPKSESLATRLRLHPDAVAALPVLQDSRALEARLDALLADGSKFRPSVALDALIADAARNFELLSACLTGGRARVRERHRRIG